MKASGRWIVVVVCMLFCIQHAVAQSDDGGPLLIVKIDRENINLTQPVGTSPVDAAEIQRARALLVRALSQMFTIIPESDKRDCIELGVVLERFHTGSGSYFIGSSAIAVGKGQDDLLGTHNPIVEPTLEKVSAAIVIQLSVMRLQASFPAAHRSNP